MQCVFILLAFTPNPFLHQNKPSQESIFCGRVDVWWITRALIMLKFLLKNRQKMMGGQGDKEVRWVVDKLTG